MIITTNLAEAEKAFDWLLNEARDSGSAATSTPPFSDREKDYPMNGDMDLGPEFLKYRAKHAVR